MSQSLCLPQGNGPCRLQRFMNRMKATLGFAASVVCTILVAFVVPYITRTVFKVSDWLSGIYWSNFPVKIFPDFWLLIYQIWIILVFYVFGMVFVGIVCGALPAVLTTEFTRAFRMGRLGKTCFLLGVPAVAYGIFGYLLWRDIIPSDLFWFRLHADGPIRKVLIVLITMLSAMVPFLAGDTGQGNAEPTKEESAVDTGDGPPPV
jgi:hypothetical protein